MSTGVILFATFLAASWGAPVWVALIGVGGMVARAHIQHREHAERFAAKHPGHELSLDPLQPTTVALLLCGAAFALGSLSRHMLFMA